MKSNKVLLLIAAAALLLIGFTLQSGDESSSPGGVAADVAVESGAEPDAGSEESTTTVAAVRFSDLPLITEDQLPDEAIDTLLLIDQGGPYPFDRDDLIFQNRERLLPDRAQGHYREYTVITPGERTRGARRVVAGADGERYYTQDHYASFLEIAWD
jgi:ribonuclease T1